jgi:hypothetical protein
LISRTGINPKSLVWQNHGIAGISHDRR